MSSMLKLEIDGRSVMVDELAGVVRIVDAAGETLHEANVQVAAGSAQGDFEEIFGE